MAKCRINLYDIYHTLELGRQMLWTLFNYAVIHVEYVFIAHILIYIIYSS